MINKDEQLEERLGHKFRDPALLGRALTHSSAIPELRAEHTGSAAQPEDNEQLEFLGDAVLDLLASEYLLEKFPDWSEGQLSKSRARLVNAQALESAARRLRLGEHLRLGRGEEKTGGREKRWKSAAIACSKQIANQPCRSSCRAEAILPRSTGSRGKAAPITRRGFKWKFGSTARAWQREKAAQRKRRNNAPPVPPWNDWNKRQRVPN